jgi:hypothetical protein
MSKSDDSEDRAQFDNDRWLVGVWNKVERKMEAHGGSERRSLRSLPPLERLVHCFGFIDYCMWNAGDLANLEVTPWLMKEARAAAAECGLPSFVDALSLPRRKLEQRYFDLFNGLVDDLKRAWRAHVRRQPAGPARRS